MQLQLLWLVLNRPLLLLDHTVLLDTAPLCRGRGSCCFGAPAVTGEAADDDEEWEDAADRMANDVVDDGGDGR